jgi:hypothetical protein
VFYRRGPPIIPCSVSEVASKVDARRRVRDHGAEVQGRQRFACFDQVPKPAMRCYVGLTTRCRVRGALRWTAASRASASTRDNPPLVWEAWTGEDWTPCDLEHDTTGGLNRPGEVVVHVPRATWSRSSIDCAPGGCGAASRSREGQPPTAPRPEIRVADRVRRSAPPPRRSTPSSSPTRSSACPRASRGSGSAARSPRWCPTGSRCTLEVAAGRLGRVASRDQLRRQRRPTDPHFVLDATAARSCSGPAVRLADGTSVQHYGAVPPKGAPLRSRVPHRWWPRGNVRAGAISVLKSSIRTSPMSRTGGHRRRRRRDLENAKVRGPIALRTRNRAVTAEDYEQLAREAARDRCAVRCGAGRSDDGTPGACGCWSCRPSPRTASGCASSS